MQALEGDTEIAQGRVALLRVMQARSINFPPDRLGDAKYLAGEQHAVWTKMLDALARIMTKGDNHDAIKTFIRALNQGISNLKAPEIVPINDIISVSSNFPIVQPEFLVTHAAAMQRDAWFWLAVIAWATADVVNTRQIVRQLGANDPVGVLADPRLIAGYLEASQMMAWSTGPAKALIARAESAAIDLDVHFRQLDELSGRHNVAITAIKEEWLTFRQDRGDELDRLKDQVTDAIRLDTSKNLWRQRTRAHLFWMLGSFAVLAVGIAALVWVILAYALPALEPGIFEILTRSAYPTQKLVLITLCVIGAAWALRFVARSIIENMTLRADAQHRQSMLDTYLALRGEVGLKDEERLIILTALFRPLPGQQADENPPTVVGETLQKLTSK